mmetsp:Transcript_8409/g.33075  ORF Transcript_8409/g.33075 Transcript_8409/m.33075 type:complete len:200 (+) Transcript_8409:543-1142(+)
MEHPPRGRRRRNLGVHAMGRRRGEVEGGRAQRVSRVRFRRALRVRAVPVRAPRVARRQRVRREGVPKSHRRGLRRRVGGSGLRRGRARSHRQARPLVRHRPGARQGKRGVPRGQVPGPRHEAMGPHGRRRVERIRELAVGERLADDGDAEQAPRRRQDVLARRPQGRERGREDRAGVRARRVHERLPAMMRASDAWVLP